MGVKRILYKLAALSLLLAMLSPLEADAQKKSAGKRKAAPRTETSADMRKREQATQREIKATKQKISTNEKSVSQGLADLNRIEADIKVTQKRVSDLSTQMNNLDKRITSLEARIRDNEASLASLRADYLRAVKKMRIAKGSSSTLSFIFSSKNFHQAMRRIRYLRQFNKWREKQTNIIRRKNEELKAQNIQLTKSKNDKNRALAQQNQARKTLQNQFARQDALVVQLKRQGDELRAHLAKKQAEANELKNSISALIAAEQAREQERKKAEQARLEKERQQKAEQARLAEQRRLQAEREEAKRQQDLANSQQLKAPKKQQKRVKKADKPVKREVKNKEKEEKRKNSERTYADARRRKPRSEKPAPSGAESSSPGVAKSATPAKPKVSGGGFESCRGSLPKPSSGAFRITSPFGRHAMPDLPGVTYDNPGIDAEVSQGASAVAVYPGRVSGIYRLPGYHTVVIVSHGDYYTVYGNLATTNVKSGDSVKQGHAIGKVADSDDGGRPTLHFEVWKNREKLNPAEWIR